MDFCKVTYRLGMNEVTWNLVISPRDISPQLVKYHSAGNQKYVTSPPFFFFLSFRTVHYQILSIYFYFLISPSCFCGNGAKFLFFLKG